MVQTIYTDGSCIGNPGPGGWAFIVLKNNNSSYEWHVSGGEIHTTNNRMELMAVIQSLEFACDKECIIYSDSKYVINCASGKWSRKKNIDLWLEYDNISIGKKIEWNWVRGHNGNKYNEIVDFLAKQEAKIIKKQ